MRLMRALLVLLAAPVFAQPPQNPGIRWDWFPPASEPLFDTDRILIAQNTQYSLPNPYLAPLSAVINGVIEHIVCKEDDGDPIIVGCHTLTFDHDEFQLTDLGSGEVSIHGLAGGGGGGTPGAPDTSIQFNNGGAFGGDAMLLWDAANDQMLFGDNAGLGALRGAHTNGPSIENDDSTLAPTLLPWKGDGGAGIGHVGSASGVRIYANGLPALDIAPSGSFEVALRGGLDLRLYDNDDSNYFELISPPDFTANRSCLLVDGSSPIPDSCVGNGVDDGGTTVVLAGDVDGASDSNDLDELAVEPELEAVLEVGELQGGLSTNQLDTITDITSGLKSGIDATLVTGTKGATDECAKWNADGDLVSTGAACATPLAQISVVYPLNPATCQNATPYLNWDHETANYPAAACITGSNTQQGVADFDQTTDECLQTNLLMPDAYTGDADVTYAWLTTATTGSVAWCTQIVCVANTESNDPAFPAQASGNCVSDAAHGSANQLNFATDTLVSIPASCGAGELMHLRVCRDPNETGGQTDNLAADARLVNMSLKIRVSL